MMKKEVNSYTLEEVFRHPLLARLSAMADQLTGVRFLIVFPKEDGWGQVAPGERVALPRFCRLVQATSSGVRRCRMCHVLMAIAACSKGLIDQRCHAGASVLVTPISLGGKENLAVLSTCTFTLDRGHDAWKELKSRGKQLGLDLKELRKSCSEMPALSPEKLELARSILGAAAEAAIEIRARVLAEAALRRLQGPLESKSALETAVETALAGSLSGEEGGHSVQTDVGHDSTIPVLVRVVADLVSRNPNMPFNVAEIAAAARMTPNHFSTLFHMNTGQSFSTFLTQRRIEMAKKLLGNLILNIAEVGQMVGYEDPSYFIRRFRQVTGMSPGEYRNSLGRG